MHRPLSPRVRGYRNKGWLSGERRIWRRHNHETTFYLRLVSRTARAPSVDDIPGGSFCPLASAIGGWKLNNNPFSGKHREAHRQPEGQYPGQTGRVGGLGLYILLASLGILFLLATLSGAGQLGGVERTVINRNVQRFKRRSILTNSGGVIL